MFQALGRMKKKVPDSQAETQPVVSPPRIEAKRIVA
jgi:hypothetical protein